MRLMVKSKFFYQWFIFEATVFEQYDRQSYRSVLH